MFLALALIGCAGPAVAMAAAAAAPPVARVDPLARCPGISLAALRQRLAAGDLARVVVFASWCAPCRAHLRDAGPDTLLLGAFDEPRRLGEVVGRTAAAAVPCVSGTALARALGVSGVPAVVSVAAVVGRAAAAPTPAGPPGRGG